MPIAGSSVMQVTWEGMCFGQKIRHVRTWGVFSNGSVAGNLNEIALQFAQVVAPGGSADFTTPYLACLSSSYTLTSITAKVLFPVQGRFASLPAAGGTVGARGVALTGNLQSGIHVWTALGGRSQVASYKIGPQASGDASAGAVVAGLQAALASYAGTFTLAIPQPSPNVISWVPCIFHRAIAKKPDVFASETWTTITGAKYETQVRVKSTRTLGRGE